MATPNCRHLCHVIQSEMLFVYHSPNHLFSHVHVFLSSLHQLEQSSHLQQSPVPLQFPLPDVVIATDATPNYGPFIFWDLVYHYWLVDPGQVLCGGLILSCRSFRLLLYRMAFHLFGKVVALHLDNSTDKAYLCNQGGTVSPFLSRLACGILSLTDKYGITLILAYIPTHLNVEANYLSWGQMISEWHLLPQVAHASFHLWGLPEVDLLASSHSTQCQHYYTLESPLPQGALELNAFNHLWTFQISYVSFSCISSSSSVQVSGRTCQRTTQTFDSGGTMLYGGSVAHHSLHSWQKFLGSVLS